MRKAREALKAWSKPALILFSDKDPITAGGDKWFRKIIPSTKEEPEIVIKDAGHFCKKRRAKKSPIGFGSFWLADRSGNNCEAGCRDATPLRGC
jgi:hypothetical protein